MVVCLFLEPVCHCAQTDRKARRAEIEDKLVVYKQRKAELTNRFQSCAVGERAEIRKLPATMIPIHYFFNSTICSSRFGVGC